VIATRYSQVGVNLGLENLVLQVPRTVRPVRHKSVLTHCMLCERVNLMLVTSAAIVSSALSL
jgi:hypothetical protein